ncbi:MAG TPA: NfeD family protein [Vicinamibacterales bacterium]|nr:NfeD family protein [Vicinamibacterales bacterium]
MDLLPPLSALTVFLAICGAGFVFLILALLFGELFHFFEADHDVGGPGFFSTRVIAVFITTFGGSGAIATHYGLAPIPASLVGLASGAVFAGAIYALARMLYDQQASTDVRVTDLVGTTGRVIVGIPRGGIGQVRVRIGEELVDKIARTSDGVPVGENASVRIEEVLGETVIVKPQ